MAEIGLFSSYLPIYVATNSHLYSYLDISPYYSSLLGELLRMQTKVNSRFTHALLTPNAIAINQNVTPLTTPFHGHHDTGLASLQGVRVVELRGIISTVV